MEYVNNHSYGELKYNFCILNNKECFSLFSNLNEDKFKLLSFKIFCIINDYKKYKRYMIYFLKIS